MSRRGPGYVPLAVGRVHDTMADGVPVRVYNPASAGDPGTVLVYMHGGGWVIGDLDTHDPLCRRMANELGAVVVSVGYRLAPEHPFPAALEDSETVLCWAMTRYPGKKHAVAGDSAGASLAAGLALRARDQLMPLAGQLLFYPATDPSFSMPSIRENGEGYFLTRADMAWFSAQYLPGGGTGIPEVDLLHADVTGVAPAVIAAAEFDPLRDEDIAYCEHLRAAGVYAVFMPGPGLIHGFAGLASVVEAADRTLSDTLHAFDQLICGGRLHGQ